MNISTYTTANPVTSQSGEPYHEYALENIKAVSNSVIQAAKTTKDEMNIDYETTNLGSLHDSFNLLVSYLTKNTPISLYEEIEYAKSNGFKCIKFNGFTYMQKGKKIVQL